MRFLITVILLILGIIMGANGFVPQVVFEMPYSGIIIYAVAVVFFVLFILLDNKIDRELEKCKESLEYTQAHNKRLINKAILAQNKVKEIQAMIVSGLSDKTIKKIKEIE
jgi:low affinity Fe/Cu permease